MPKIKYETLKKTYDSQKDLIDKVLFVVKYNAYSTALSEGWRIPEEEREKLGFNKNGKLSPEEFKCAESLSKDLFLELVGNRTLENIKNAYYIFGLIDGSYNIDLGKEYDKTLAEMAKEETDKEKKAMYFVGMGRNKPAMMLNGLYEVMSNFITFLKSEDESLLDFKYVDALWDSIEFTKEMTFAEFAKKVGMEPSDILGVCEGFKVGLHSKMFEGVKNFKIKSMPTEKDKITDELVYDHIKQIAISALKDGQFERGRRDIKKHISVEDKEHYSIGNEVMQHVEKEDLKLDAKWKNKVKFYLDNEMAIDNFKKVVKEEEKVLTSGKSVNAIGRVGISEVSHNKLSPIDEQIAFDELSPKARAAVIKDTYAGKKTLAEKLQFIFDQQIRAYVSSMDGKEPPYEETQAADEIFASFVEKYITKGTAEQCREALSLITEINIKAQADRAKQYKKNYDLFKGHQNREEKAAWLTMASGFSAYRSVGNSVYMGIIGGIKLHLTNNQVGQDVLELNKKLDKESLLDDVNNEIGKEWLDKYGKDYLNESKGRFTGEIYKRFDKDYMAPKNVIYSETANVVKKPAAKGPSYERYIELHTGANAIGNEDKEIDCFAKAVAASLLKHGTDKFDLNKVHVMADGIKQMRGFDVVVANPEKRKHYLASEKNMSEATNLLINSTYRIPKYFVKKYVDSMKTLFDSLMSDRERSNEYKAFYKAVKKIADCKDKYDFSKEKDLIYASRQMMELNAKLIDSIRIYIKDKMSVRWTGNGKERFNNTLDALSIVRDCLPTSGPQIDKLVGMINKARIKSNEVNLSDYSAERAKQAKVRREAKKK